ncbi:MAG TPA: hypothetical protein VE131_03225 [Terriglobales bacterium]|nr:hypothetical protein [Terriglobales bacterium]
MKEEQAYERLMRTLQVMQAQIDEGFRPLAEQVFQAEVERLCGLSKQQRSILQDCIARIDQSILNCRAQMEDYRRARSELIALNERLANLGAEPVPVPDHFPMENLGDLILSRLEGLRAKGKI